MKKLFITIFVGVLAISNITNAQDKNQQRNKSQSNQNSEEILLVDKVALTKFLSLSDEQKKKIEPEIDAVAKLIEPVKQEKQRLIKLFENEKMSEEDVLKYQAEFEKRYKVKEEQIQKRIKTIEGFLTKVQKEKFLLVIKPTTEFRKGIRR